MFPKISIVIAGYNCSQTIEETLKACLNQDYPRDLYEVIFVDDGSNDGTQESVRKFPVRYIWQPHSGPAKARNIGWQEAEGEIIFFTDSDCVPDEEWIRTLIKNFNYEKVGAVGGSYGIKNSKSLLANCIYAEILWRHQKMSREVKALGSYNLALRKEILKELNGFDESYLSASGEDNDLCYRLREKGYRLIFEPRALVYHYYPERIFAYLRHQFWHGYWRVKLYKRHFKMVRGDDYSGFLDFLPPLFVLFLGFLNLLLFIELFRALRIVLYTKKSLYLYLYFVILLRDFWRGGGLLLGLFKFFVI